MNLKNKGTPAVGIDLDQFAGMASIESHAEIDVQTYSIDAQKP